MQSLIFSDATLNVGNGLSVCTIMMRRDKEYQMVVIAKKEGNAIVLEVSGEKFKDDLEQFIASPEGALTLIAMGVSVPQYAAIKSECELCSRSLKADADKWYGISRTINLN